MILMNTLNDSNNSVETLQTENKHCPHCGARLKEWWHVLTPGVVGALRKFATAVHRYNRNDINPRKDLDGTDLELTKNEDGNWSVLRYHGLVAHVRKPDGTRKGGYWLLTRRGGQFLRNEIAIPRRVKSWRNRIVGYDQKFIRITDLKDVQPFYETIDTVEYDIHESHPKKTFASVGDGTLGL